jgi:MoaD family protein
VKVRLQYLGQISAVLHKRGETVEAASKTTIYTLLKQLTGEYGDVFKREVFDEGEKEVREGVIVTVNGRAIGQLQGTDTRLQGGDVITLLPLFAGGG